MKDKSIVIQYNGKDVTGTLIEPGIVERQGRKGATSYFIECAGSGKWCYCSADRLEKLRKKLGDKVGTAYFSREFKAELKLLEAPKSKAKKAKKAAKRSIKYTKDKPIDVLDQDLVDELTNPIDDEFASLDASLDELEHLNA